MLRVLIYRDTQNSQLFLQTFGAVQLLSSMIDLDAMSTKGAWT